MTKKYLKRAREQLSRRRAMQAMGSLLGTAAFGCGDAPGENGTGSSTSGDPSTGEGPGTSSTGDLTPTTGSATGDSSTSSAGDSSAGDSSAGDTSAGDTSTSDGTSTTGEPFNECGGGAQLSPQQLLASVDHIIVLVMENRSFDHFLGSRKAVEGLAIDGLVGDESNLGPDLVPVPVFVMDEFEPLDPPHDWDQCHFQFNLGENNGFVVVNENKNPGFGYQAMGYHVREHLPVTHGLADNFTVCERWFASVMGPTWPNRYFIHACDSGGGKTNFPDPFLKTLWHRCNDVGISSRIYFGDVPWVAGAFPLVPTVWGKLADDVNGFSIDALTNPNTLSRFFDDAEAGKLPNFAIIDPGFTSNDDHPSHNIQLGQILIGSIYKALAEGPAWAKTLLIITYDEHGGFYDHVAPPKTIDQRPEFTQLGFRVPSMVIGPSVRRGCVNDLQFEHCSIGATLMKRFGIVPLNERMAQARDVSSCIHPDYIADPQPGPPVPLVDVSISEILADVGHTTSQEELFLAAGVTIDEDFKRKVRDDTMQLLLRAQKLGVARLRP